MVRSGAIVTGTQALVTLLDGNAFEIVMGRFETATGALRLSLRESFSTDDAEQPLTLSNFYYDATYGADAWESVSPDGQELVPGHTELRPTTLTRILSAHKRDELSHHHRESFPEHHSHHVARSVHRLDDGGGKHGRSERRDDARWHMYGGGVREYRQFQIPR